MNKIKQTPEKASGEVREQPWPEDAIDFLDGDWKIYRSSVPGLYRYEAGGIFANNEVDAVQLIEWGMAKRHRYGAMTPWENSGLTFADGAQVLRDLADFSADCAARAYFVDGAHGGFLRVDGFWLKWKGYVSEIDERVADRYRPKESEKHTALCNTPWESDHIVFRRRKGYKVERSVREGSYRVFVGGATYNATAARLLEDRLALTAEEKSWESQSRFLAKLAHSEEYTLEQLRARLSAVLPADEVNAASQLTDFALLSDRYGDRVAKEAAAHSAAVSARGAALARLRQEARALSELANAIAVELQSLRMREAGIRLAIYDQSRRLGEARKKKDYGSAEQMDSEIYQTLNDTDNYSSLVRKELQNIQSLLRKYRALDRSALDDTVTGTLPDQIRKALNTEILSASVAEADARNALADLESHRLILEEEKSLESVRAIESVALSMKRDAEQNVGTLRALSDRNTELRNFFLRYFSVTQSKTIKPLLRSHRPWEGDGIVFCKTKFHIVRKEAPHGEEDGTYTVISPDKTRTIVVSAKELVTYHLAQYI